MSFASNFVTTYQTRLKERKQQLQVAQKRVQEAESEFRRAQNVLQSARYALTAAFTQKNVAVPHLVNQATWSAENAVALQELEFSRREKEVETSRQLVSEQLHWVSMYQHDIGHAMDVEKQLALLRQRQRREEAVDERMFASAKDAMNSAKSTVEQVQSKIQLLEVKLQSLLS